MQREWVDPRDRTSWLVTLSPFGAAALRERAGGVDRLTISFHRPGQRPWWTRYELEVPLVQASDQELMDLLDAARRQDPASRRRPAARRYRTASRVERPSA